MQEYTTEYLRNIAMVSHSGAGKTMLSEAFLFFTKAINRMGQVEDANTVADFEEEEQRRGLSLSTALLPIEYQQHKLNLLDTPGAPDFVGEMISALSVSDAALVVVDSVAGVQVGTELAWQTCDRFDLPRFVLVNRMHRESADFEKAKNSVAQLTDKRLIPVQIPWGQGPNFQGLVDLLIMKAYPIGGGPAVEIPAELVESAQTARQQLVEAAAEGSDELLEKYLESGELSAEEIMLGLQGVVRRGLFVPVFAADASDQVGISQLLQAFITLIPSPAQARPAKATGPAGEETLTAKDDGPLAAYIWKTTADPYVGKITYGRLYSGQLSSESRAWNPKREQEERLTSLAVLRGKEQLPVKHIHAGDIFVVAKLGETATGDTLCDKSHPLELPVPEFPKALYQVAVTPKTQADSAKMGPTLTRLAEEDMTLSWHNEPATKQTILQGMGDQHIDVAIRKAQDKFQVGIEVHEPKVPYLETIQGQGQAVYRHKKQSGGSGQFAEVHLRLEPLPSDEFEFASEVFGGAISSNYFPAIEKGIRSVLASGAVAGYPVKNVKAIVFDGKEHPVDSKPVAFEIAGRQAFKEAFRQAKPVLLEPVMQVRISVPEDKMGDVIGDLNSRRAQVQGMEQDGGRAVVNALVPLAEMLRYTSDLRSISGGRGAFSMEPAQYEQVPAHLADSIIAAHKDVGEEED
ncbi:MAG: elongation factor G [Anaerolineales bacterium]|nr:elongation factor G [Anaerolineales bacterium]MCW5855985.1 elongation factor G [Anaerolineales bacterium]